MGTARAAHALQFISPKLNMAFPRMPTGLLPSVLLALLLIGRSVEAVVTYELVTVGDAGNGRSQLKIVRFRCFPRAACRRRRHLSCRSTAHRRAAPDATGYGGVGYSYAIGKYEVTISQWVTFLQAVASANDTYGVWNPQMSSSGYSAGISQTGSPGNYTYAAIPPLGVTPPGAASAGNRPIAYLNWFSSARFANWMANGQPTGSQVSSTTEDGAYALNGAKSGTVVALNPINPNTGEAPTYYIPREDEWYKVTFIFSIDYFCACVWFPQRLLHLCRRLPAWRHLTAGG
jgi:hypothetical protein